ncbi:hypothetical protein ACOME3_005621 [Neoechinorhynchus agilis]
MHTKRKPEMTSLAIVVNCEIAFWYAADRKFKLRELIDQLCMFNDAFIACSELNRTVVYLTFRNTCLPLTASRGFLTESKEELQAKLDTFIDDHRNSTDVTAYNKGLIRAMIKSTLHFQSHPAHRRNAKKRIILIVPGSEFYVRQMDFFNCAFSCEKLSIPTDTILLQASIPKQNSKEEEMETMFKQASSLTSGVFLCFRSLDGLWSDLLTTVLCPTKLCTTQQDKESGMNITARTITPTCFCHNVAANICYLCRSCMAIYCEPFVECESCGSFSLFGDQ